MIRRDRNYRTEGVVLKSMVLGEADLLVTFYTKETGKNKAIARGVRKPTSRLVGHLEPLTRVELSMARGKNLDVVNQAEALYGFASLKNHLTNLSKGLYIAELVDGFGVEGSANLELYCLMIKTLLHLERNPELDLALRYFELHLLKSSGFGLELYNCVQCRERILENNHQFSPDLGGTICSYCVPPSVLIKPLSLRALKVLRFFDRSGLSNLATLNVDKTLSDELAVLLGSGISYWVDREIRSKRFLEHLQYARPEGV